ISRLRAIEHRRAIARSANTGRSGFISARGDVGETLGWDERGTIASTLALDTRQTFYTRYGDYLGRIAEYVMLLCVLYYTAYRVKRRNYLVK
ncbi:MAG: apolipoprotein N-acyltransferase, partial [Alistipes sp.]|nr:apolipoprotein N-acyltransferase [Alistipes sp.]